MTWKYWDEKTNGWSYLEQGTNSYWTPLSTNQSLEWYFLTWKHNLKIRLTWKQLLAWKFHFEPINIPMHLENFTKTSVLTWKHHFKLRNLTTDLGTSELFWYKIKFPG